jgi:hypothetical protein
MNLKSLVVVAMSVVLLVSVSCDGLKSKKNQKKYDSLFLGFSLGMQKKAFYDLCTEYNRKKLFTHGPTNQSVEYLLKNEAKSNVIMRFYPSFENEKIYEMPVTFTYEAWAPWNRQFQSDSLLNEMRSVFKKWYGDDFQVIDHKTMGKIYARIDGKRRINLFIKDDQFVQAVFTDLEVEDQKLEKEKKQIEK